MKSGAFIYHFFFVGLNSTQLQLVPASVASIDTTDPTKINVNQQLRYQDLYTTYVCRDFF